MTCLSRLTATTVALLLGATTTLLAPAFAAAGEPAPAQPAPAEVQPAAPARPAKPIRTTPQQRDAAATVAASKAGASYARGAAGPNAFDCSGLVDFAYRTAGIPLEVRTSYEMWNLGQPLTRSQVRRGDLVFTWDTAAGHVGIYIGNGKYVHAPAPGRAVEIAPLPPLKHGFVGAVRP